jgi:hypothetical protein
MPIRPSGVKLTLDELPWIPENIRKSLSVMVPFLVQSLAPGLARIGLYGSWQRGDAGPQSDVDLVVFLRSEVGWFDPEKGMGDRSAARKDKLRWHALEQKANALRLEARVYSIAVVTPGMLTYYQSKGPIHLQNWAHALMNCYPLWGIE